METAKCIGVCTGFKSQEQEYLEVSSVNYREISEVLDKFSPNVHCLVVTGASLEIILGHELLLDLFLTRCKSADSVIICRCAPKQKAEVAQILKEKYGKVVCCIGDGGNDVGMIKEASIGIGIEGKEGLQASLASDVSVKQFKDIQKLFLWHGRLSYQRTSKLANFVVHRGLIITTIQVIFITLYYYVSINIYNGYLVMGYSTVFTNFPVFSLILDKDIKLGQVMDFPVLYSYTRDGRGMNLLSFFIWMWKSIVQGACIIMLSLWTVDSTFLSIVTVTFSALIFIGTFALYPDFRIPQHRVAHPDLACLHCHFHHRFACSLLHLPYFSSQNLFAVADCAVRFVQNLHDFYHHLVAVFCLSANTKEMFSNQD